MKYCQVVCLIAAVIFAAGCSSTQVISDKFNTPIIINGEKSDWLSNTSKYTLHYFQDQNTTVGISNDEKFVYFYLMTNNRTNTMQILNLGLHITVKSDAGEFTFAFPEKRDMRDMFIKMREQRSGEEPGVESGDERTLSVDSANMKNITILDSKGEPIEKIPHYKNRYGLEAAANMDENHALIYEFRVPIMKDKAGQYGVFCPEGKFSVEMKTEMPKRTEKKEDDIMGDPGGFGGVNGGDPNGGMGGGGMGGGGGRGGRPGGGRFGGRSGDTKSFDLSFDVMLAK